MRSIIGLTMGDASGVGPEIILKALNHKETYKLAKPIVIGDYSILEREATSLNLGYQFHLINHPAEGKFEQGTIDCIDLKLLGRELPYGKVSAKAGNAAFHYIETAVRLAMDGKIDAICTAPINKEALHKGGHIYPGHTEILAQLTGTKDFSMMLSTPKLKVIHLTTHVGLLEAIDRINPDRTYNVIKLAHDTFAKAGKEDVKIAVCGINPHAGENGMFGNGEEEEKLVPGISKAQKENINVTGPYPADTLFYRAARGDFDVVVACYHDQGHGPVKVLGVESGVNITVGLKHGVIRTSVDHGTAFDIAGKNLADERSLIEAIKAAIDLSPKKNG
ncbi:4-hydroxythreonine-4-phosphate dehydrogenase PdxA [Radiobacillus kanasensis]|uniref:4-hydroxythreonine-4-phosphate dehydrogenase PdxA n=1 Tax=Radiobacillus kanasensis TaxID=2844358 RepID=UPI001E452FC5|nr:4-hydroxythreonine-4-phosphate dehydrogenase PdxA [Radiobacillus kanasensis]UFT98786.1 4-hydroxythreonine-4-phosphate dehydrogenase PdxA [Radiobacillus kanasensis]